MLYSTFYYYKGILHYKKLIELLFVNMLYITRCNFNVIITNMEVCDVPITKKYLGASSGVILWCICSADDASFTSTILIPSYPELWPLFASYVGQILLYCTRRNHIISCSIIQIWVENIRKWICTQFSWIHACFDLQTQDSRVLSEQYAGQVRELNVLQDEVRSTFQQFLPGGKKIELFLLPGHLILGFWIVKHWIR